MLVLEHLLRRKSLYTTTHFGVATPTKTLGLIRDTLATAETAVMVDARTGPRAMGVDVIGVPIVSTHPPVEMDTGAMDTPLIVPEENGK